MIRQIAPVPAKTEPLPKINQALLHARQIQTQVEQKLAGRLPTQVHMWSPITAGPYIVPVTRWIE